MSIDLSSLSLGIPYDCPPNTDQDYHQVPHAPKRVPHLTKSEVKLAIKNSLRYFPKRLHVELAKEFAGELRNEGHIYMKRYRPTYKMAAYPISNYPAKLIEAKCIMMMIMNNLSPEIAQFPHELITYGGNGSVFSNWAQYHLMMYYLSNMTNTQTLTCYSGHPAGLFPSSINAPRLVITNGMVIPNYSSKEDYDRMYALGVSQYGQMTAGSYCYIGPQGIVHGTTLVILNACRKYLNGQYSGKVYVSSGLGGMSGAQGKAGRIVGCISVIGEIDRSAIEKRYKQGWIDEIIDNVDDCIKRVLIARENKEAIAIGFLGNIVALLESFASNDNHVVDICSDQTSLHNPYNGGYYPVSLTFEESKVMMAQNPVEFKTHVQNSLKRHATAVKKLVAKGSKFWDYGNSFLLEAGRAGADIFNDSGSFIFPTYFQEFMGDIFSLGFGPFRWVCCSGLASDLQLTDKIAADILIETIPRSPERVANQLKDNLLWIQKAEENKLVVGSQARILYADAETRVNIALAINKAIAEGKLGPVVLSRDHHDVSGTDSPYRETSSITDGSMFCADMAVQNCIGDAFRGATWVSLHNGGGCGWGEVINGGFGHVLDGTDESGARAKSMLFWDVNNGISRRAWAGNYNANFAIDREMERTPGLEVTIANVADDSILENL